MVERYVGHFNRGDSLYAKKMYGQARGEFSRALELAPDRCDVRFNLVLSIESIGDGHARDRSDGPARTADRDALDVVDERSCPPSRPDDPGDRLAEAEARIRVKLEGASKPQSKRK